MNSRNIQALCIFISIFMASSSLAALPDNPQVLFQKADQHYEQIRTLSFKVDRELKRGMQKQQESWKVYLSKPQSIRIEYDGPPKRIIRTEGTHYSEYIPKVKKAMELDIGRVSDQKREEIFASLMPRVAIPGFRLGITPDMLESMDFKVLREETLGTVSTYYIEGRDKKKKDKQGVMKIWIDQDKAALVRLEIYQGKQFITSIQSENFRKFESGSWLPMRVTVRNNTPDAMETAVYRISKLQANPDFQGDLFKAGYPTGVEVVKPGVKKP